jgi:hypothetical protein
MKAAAAFLAIMSAILLWRNDDPVYFVAVGVWILVMRSYK